MKSLAELTLVELAIAFKHGTTEYTDGWLCHELERRQAMLDAAEAMAVAASSTFGFKVWNVKDWQTFNGKTRSEWDRELSKCLAAYAAAKAAPR